MILIRWTPGIGAPGIPRPSADAISSESSSYKEDRLGNLPGCAIHHKKWQSEVTNTVSYLSLEGVEAGILC